MLTKDFFNQQKKLQELQDAIALADSDSVKKALSSGADPNFADVNGVTPYGFLIQARYLFGEPIPEFKNAFAHMEKALLDKGATLQATGLTPLSYAVLRQDIVAVRELISSGVSVDEKIENDTTALFVAVRMGNLEIVDALIKAGADVNHFDKLGYTPLSIMVNMEDNQGKVALHYPKYQQIKNFLLQNAADTRRIGLTPLSFAILTFDDKKMNEALARGDDVNEIGSLGFSALNCAAQRGNVAAVVLLLDKGANPNFVPSSGVSPLMSVCGRDMMRSAQDEYQIAQILLAHEANANDVDENELLVCSYSNSENQQSVQAVGFDEIEEVQASIQDFLQKKEQGLKSDRMFYTSRYFTPLSKAVLFGRADIVELLMKNYAFPTLADDKGQTALDALAFMRGFAKADKAVLDKMAQSMNVLL